MKKTAVITGGNRGIGLELCRQLGRLGFSVVLGSRNMQKGKAAATALAKDGVSVTVAQMDMLDAKSIDHAKTVIQSTLGEIGLLINGAGILTDYETPLLEVDPEDIRHTFDTNTVGTVRICQALVPLMNAGSRIINISSGMGQLSDMGSGAIAYRVSKTVLNTVTRVLANELKGREIAVNAICPGWVQTDMGGCECDSDGGRECERNCEFCDSG